MGFVRGRCPIRTKYERRIKRALRTTNSERYSFALFDSQKSVVVCKESMKFKLQVSRKHIMMVSVVVIFLVFIGFLIVRALSKRRGEGFAGYKTLGYPWMNEPNPVEERTEQCRRRAEGTHCVLSDGGMGVCLLNDVCRRVLMDYQSPDSTNTIVGDFARSCPFPTIKSECQNYCTCLYVNEGTNAPFDSIDKCTEDCRFYFV